MKTAKNPLILRSTRMYNNLIMSNFEEQYLPIWPAEIVNM